MGRSPCCEKLGLKKGPWTPEEDNKLMSFIENHGHGSWRALPAKAGLQRCGKSCRLRWTNYLRPDIKRGKFSLQEEQTIIQLHALLGNRWSAIAAHLPKRTDNEIKNYWNTHLKKRLSRMGIDPVTHKPKSDALGPTQLKDAVNLSHMAQWESARLQAEARHSRESEQHLHLHLQGSNPFQTPLRSSVLAQLLNNFEVPPPLLPPPPPPPPPPPLCLDVLTAWGAISGGNAPFRNLEPRASTFSFSDNPIPISNVGSFGDNNSLLEGVDYIHDMVKIGGINGYESIGNGDIVIPDFMEGVNDIMLGSSSNLNSFNTGESSNQLGGIGYCNEFEENKIYWNNVLNLVNCSPSGFPVF